MRKVLVESIGETASTWTRFLSITICCLLLSVAAFAQSDRGTITGSVFDPSSAAVVGAKVVVKNVETGSTFDATTTTAGDFTIPSVPSGKYDLSVTAPGFKTANQNGIQVLLDQTIKIPIALQVGQITDAVTVTAEAEMLKTANAEISMNVRGDKVNDLPINFGGGGSAGGGIRNWLSFVYLAPGVAGTSATAQVNGLPTGAYGSFKVYLEGQDSTSLNDASWTSTVAAASVEAITEFAVQSSNFSAEFGQVMGGLYNFTTKSGTNKLHGSVYEEWANEALDARHPFNHLLDRDRKNDYGFTIGGPVWIPKIYNGKNLHLRHGGLKLRLRCDPPRRQGARGAAASAQSMSVHVHAAGRRRETAVQLHLGIDVAIGLQNRQPGSQQLESGITHPSSQVERGGQPSLRLPYALTQAQTQSVDGQACAKGDQRR